MEQVRVADGDDLDRLVELAADFHASRSGRRGVVRPTRPTDGGGHPPEPTRDEVGAYLTGPGPDGTGRAPLDDWVAGAALCRVDQGTATAAGCSTCASSSRAPARSASAASCSSAPSTGSATRGAPVSTGRRSRATAMAKQFFESAGFKARLLVMHLPLD